MTDFDCAVVGGGMVGAASALALAEQGLTVIVIEKSEPKAFESTQPLDLRVSAISLSSQYLLEQLGAWYQIKQWRTAPYKRLGVWEQECAYTEFNADNIEQPHLGHIVENRLIQLALWQRIITHPKITMLCPENVISLEQQTDMVTLVLSKQTITSKLVIGADGANSQVRSLTNIGISSWDYAQSAMLVNVKTAVPQQDITWQQFFPTGPVAFLPLPNTLKEERPAHNKGNASLVWYHQKDEIKRLTSLSNQQLQQEISSHFPKRLGQIEVVDKASFPLTRRHATHYFNKRVVLLGDAAHTINPMAGQGVNLGFKDVKALQTVIASAISEGKCWHDKSVLAQYEKLRRTDNLFMQSTMDALYVSFSHPSMLIKGIRNLALLSINKLPIINSNVKNKALAYACGL